MVLSHKKTIMTAWDDYYNITDSRKTFYFDLPFENETGGGGGRLPDKLKLIEIILLVIIFDTLNFCLFLNPLNIVKISTYYIDRNNTRAIITM